MIGSRSGLLFVLLHVVHCQPGLFNGLSNSLPSSDLRSTDLLQAISVPLGHNVTFLTGFDGYPSFKIGLEADIQVPASTIVPSILYENFAILITIKPDSNKGGYLFAIVSPKKRLVQFGLKLKAFDIDYQDLSLLFTQNRDDLKEQVSRSIATFRIPSLANKWSRLAIKVKGQKITLYVDCDEYQTTIYPRSDDGLLHFVKDSMLYLGSGGPIKENIKYSGALQELHIYNNPEEASSQCDEGYQVGQESSGHGSATEQVTSTLTDVKLTTAASDLGFGVASAELTTTQLPPPPLTAPPPIPPSVYPHVQGVVKGQKGDPGLRGYKGKPGVKGQQGDPGAQGFAGLYGPKGTKGDEGDKGDRGLPGPPGSPMYDPQAAVKPAPGLFSPVGSVLTRGNMTILRAEKGQKGELGPSGFPGLDGTQGVQGQAGTPGTPGTVGSVGPRGDKGTKGEQGESIVGPRGLDGTSIQGAKGDPGSPGRPGESIVGPRGPPGEMLAGSGDEALKGDRGPPGLMGPRGLPGEVPKNLTKNGIPGIKGDQGLIGPIGPPGIGEKGDSGVEGRDGDRGSKGEPGDLGPRGLPGPPGPSGRATMLERFGFGSGGSGDGEVVNGNPGPRGLPGARGGPGPRGDKGDMGTPGYQGDRGLQGPVGPQGLRGERGVPGESGIPGLPGDTGEPGIIGEKGETGPQGAGVPGSRGPPGPPGPPGAPVLSGLGSGDEESLAASKGEKGEQGLLGPQGIRGEDGIPGKPGMDGMDGLPGAAGTPGLPGLDGFKGKSGSSGAPGTPGLTGQKGEQGVCDVTSCESIARKLFDSSSLLGAKGEPGLGLPGPRGLKGEPGSVPLASGAIFPGGFGPKGVGAVSSRGAHGDKGERGYGGVPGRKGDIGDPGLDGMKGQKGDPGQVVTSTGNTIAGPKGDRGDPGPIGLPGIGIVGPHGRPGPPGREPYIDEHLRKRLRGLPGPQGERGPPGPPGVGLGDHVVGANQVTAGAVTFPTLAELVDLSRGIPVGTLAYIIDQQALYIRVNDGWQYVNLGSLIPLPAPKQPQTTELPPFVRPPQDTGFVNGPMLHIAALNDPMSGNMNGIRGADYRCYKQARAAGMKGTYRAFLASRVQNLDSLIYYKTDKVIPIVNIKNQKLISSWNSLFDGNGGSFNRKVPLYSFNGKDVLKDPTWPQKIIWHGSDKRGQRQSRAYCNAWRSNKVDRAGLASSLLNYRLLDQETYSCRGSFIVLCIENTHRKNLRK